MKKLLIIVLLLCCAVPVIADDWKVHKRYQNQVPVSVSYASGCYTFIYESGKFWICHDSYMIEKTFYNITLGEVGSIYIQNSGNKNKKHKWVQNKELTAKRKALKNTPPVIQIKPIEVKKPIKKTSTVWVKVSRDLPPKAIIVLVKYKNGLYTTAYLNMKNEWKLATDREKMFEGDNITTIEYWRIIE